eukprot:897523_1
MGNGRSKRPVDTSNVEFSVRIRDLRIVNFNNYTQFNPGFQSRFSLNVWSEFRQSIEAAVNSYTQDQQLTQWKGTYKCLNIIPLILVGISGISGIYSFYALFFGLIFGATGVWVSAVILICLICVWALIGFVIRNKLSSLKVAYHGEIETRVQNAVQQLNARYNGICQFQIERITGAKSVDFDFSIIIGMFFKITLFQQQVNQPYGAIGQSPPLVMAQNAQVVQQPQSVMVQMPNGQMVMAQVVQPVNQMPNVQMGQPQYMPVQQQNGPQYVAPSIP